FSSRRRHTRFSRDWSSDVCSSDLTARDMSESLGKHEVERPKYSVSRCRDHRNSSDNMDRSVEDVVTAAQIRALPALEGYVASARSEERRVGKERSGRWRAADGEEG